MNPFNWVCAVPPTEKPVIENCHYEIGTAQLLRIFFLMAGSCVTACVLGVVTVCVGPPINAMVIC